MCTWGAVVVATEWVMVVVWADTGPDKGTIGVAVTGLPCTDASDETDGISDTSGVRVNSEFDGVDCIALTVLEGVLIPVVVTGECSSSIFLIIIGSLAILRRKSTSMTIPSSMLFKMADKTAAIESAFASEDVAGGICCCVFCVCSLERESPCVVTETSGVIPVADSYSSMGIRGMTGVRLSSQHSFFTLNETKGLHKHKKEWTKFSLKRI